MYIYRGFGRLNTSKGSYHFITICCVLTEGVIEIKDYANQMPRLLNNLSILLPEVVD